MSLAEEEDYASEVEPSVENELSDYHDWDAGPSTEDIFSSEEGLVGSEGPDDEAGEGEAGEDCVQEDGQEQEEIAVLHEVSEEEEDDFVSEDLYDDLFDGDFLPYEVEEFDVDAFDFRGIDSSDEDFHFGEETDDESFPALCDHCHQAEDYMASAAWQNGPDQSGGWVYQPQLFPELLPLQHHIQVADALHTFKNQEGKWEVLLATKEALLLSTLESDESCSVFRKLAAEKLLFDPYSMSRSSDGSIIALGGRVGQIALYSWDAKRDSKKLRLGARLLLGRGHCIAHNLVNSVRFHAAGKQEYIFAGCQDGNVYVLRAPTYLTDTAAGRQFNFKACLVNTFPAPDGQPLVHGNLERQPVAHGPESTIRELDAGRVHAAVGTISSHLTMAFDGLNSAVNAAQPSPCGNYLAILRDDSVVFVAWLGSPDAVMAGQYKKLETAAKQQYEGLSEAPDYSAGAQYCSWSPDSKFLAVSSDLWNSILVWTVPEFENVIRIEGTGSRPLALQFCPSRPGLLAICEQKLRCYLVDVRDVVEAPAGSARKHSCQCIHSFPFNPFIPTSMISLNTDLEDKSYVQRERDLGSRRLGLLSGLAYTDTSILLATQAGVLHLRLLNQWSTKSHKHFPAKFKVIIKTLLLCAKAASRTTEGKPGLIDLPGPAMFQVIQELAKDLPVYFPEPANMPIIHHIQREQA